MRNCAFATVGAVLADRLFAGGLLPGDLEVLM